MSASFEEISGFLRFRRYIHFPVPGFVDRFQEHFCRIAFGKQRSLIFSAFRGNVGVCKLHADVQVLVIPQNPDFSRFGDSIAEKLPDFRMRVFPLIA